MERYYDDVHYFNFLLTQLLNHWSGSTTSKTLKFITDDLLLWKIYIQLPLSLVDLKFITRPNFIKAWLGNNYNNNVIVNGSTNLNEQYQTSVKLESVYTVTNETMTISGWKSFHSFRCRFTNNYMITSLTEYDHDDQLVNSCSWYYDGKLEGRLESESKIYPATGQQVSIHYHEYGHGYEITVGNEITYVQQYAQAPAEMVIGKHYNQSAVPQWLYDFAIKQLAPNVQQ